jgi:hypothetical protein
MDPLAASAVSQSQAMIQNQVAVSVLKMSLDIAAEQGAELVQMMSQRSGIGQQVNLSA